MYNIAICDDMPVLAKTVKDNVDKFFSEREMDYNIDIYYTGEELYKALEYNNYNMVFLDVELGDMNGMDLAAVIRKNYGDIKITIVSSYIEYACRGYEIRIFRYIVRNNSMQQKMNECLSDALRSYHFEKRKKLITFKEEERIIFIKDIIYIESYSHYLTFHIYENGIEKQYHLRAKLDDIEADINSELLYRANKSELINMLYFERRESNQLYLKNGACINISRKYIGGFTLACYYLMNV